MPQEHWGKSREEQSGRRLGKYTKSAQAKRIRNGRKGWDELQMNFRQLLYHIPVEKSKQRCCAAVCIAQEPRRMVKKNPAETPGWAHTRVSSRSSDIHGAQLPDVELALSFSPRPVFTFLQPSHPQWNRQLRNISHPLTFQQWRKGFLWETSLPLNAADKSSAVTC